MKHEFDLKIKYSDARPAEKSAFTIAFNRGKSIFETILTETKEFFVTVSGMNIFVRIAPLYSKVILDHIAAVKVKISTGIMASAIAMKEVITLSFGNLLKIFSNQEVSIVISQLMHIMLKMKLAIDSSVVVSENFTVREKLRIAKSAPVTFVHSLVERTLERFKAMHSFVVEHNFVHLNISQLLRLGYWDNFNIGETDSLTLAEMDAEDII